MKISCSQTVTTTSVARKPEPTNSNILYKIPTGEWDIDAELDVAEGKCDVEKGGVVECISPMDLPIRITETSNGYGLENKFWAELNATLNPPENNAGLYWFELIDHYNATNEFGPCRQDVNVTLMLGESYRYQLIM